MKLFIKNNIKFIILIIICLVGSSITTLATNYLFNSNEVSYDNTESGLHADEVQGAIDEVFQHATDYSEIKSKIGTGSLTTTSNTLIGGINEVNNKLIMPTLTTYTSFADLKTAIINRANTMENGAVASIAFNIQNVTEFPTGRRYAGTISKYGDNFIMIDIVSQKGEMVSIAYENGDWHVESISSKLTTVEEDTVTLTSGNCYVYKILRLVTIHISGVSGNGDTEYTLGTLPEKYRPKSQIKIQGLSNINNVNSLPFEIWTNGKIIAGRSSINFNYGGVTVSYISAS